MSANRKPIDVEALFPQIATIGDWEIARHVREIWLELWDRSEWEDFETMPTSPEISYPARPHAQCVVEMALQIAQSFERFHGVKVDRDHLVAAAILQDASKVVEYARDPDGGAKLSPSGENYPHAFVVASMAMERGLAPEIVNSILLHTPQAARFPRTIEGKILYYVDQLDVIAIHGDRWKKELFITK